MQSTRLVPRKFAASVRSVATSVARSTRRRAAVAAALATLALGCTTAPTAPKRLAVPEPVSTRPIAVDQGPSDAAVLADAPDSSDAPTRRVLRVDPAELFDPARDRAILEALRSEEIVAVERGRGGRSLAFRVTLASGARAYFKPEQTFSGTHWYAEIAAFHLDRALGIHRTAPSTGRVLPWALLEPAAIGDGRIDEIVVGEDGMVRGVLVAWIEERLVPLDPPDDWMADLRITAAAGTTPFVPARELRRLRGTPDAALLDAGTLADADVGASGALDAGPIDASAANGWDRERRAAELSDLILFDFLIHNGDRWGGGFTNVRTRGADGPLVYLDNAAGFSRRRARLTTLDLRLTYVQRFGSALVRRLRRFELDGYEQRLATDPLAPVLDEQQLAHLEERRVAALAHVDALVEVHGRERVLAW